MASEVLVGKYAIESLTTGMYTDPFVMYREYVQNASDSLDEAIESGLMHAGQTHIKIKVNPALKTIIIEDNGVGIAIEKAYRVLSDIGNSQKTQGKQRGFRGIGRFSGLSYCDRLTFSTSCFGEEQTYSITYNAQKLRTIISDNSGKASAGEAMSLVINEKTTHCSAETHFFRVTLEGVHANTGLLDCKKIEEYLRETSPVRYSRSFSWGQEIEETIRNTIGEIKQYRMTLEIPGDIIEIEKPYADTILLNKQTNTYDKITSIDFYPLHDTNGNQLGCVWYGASSYTGTIVSKDVKGLRLRVGNILVGDSTTLNNIFKDSRFNGWVIGEVVVNSGSLVLNARRDNFEFTELYYFLIEQLRVLANNITKNIRSASIVRNKELESIVENAHSVTKQVDHLLSEDTISKVERDTARSRIIAVRQQLLNYEAKSAEVDARRDMIEQLDLLIGRVQGTSSYKAINLLPDLSASDKKLLDRMFTKLYQQNGSDLGDKYVEAILKALS